MARPPGRRLRRSRGWSAGYYLVSVSLLDGFLHIEQLTRPGAERGLRFDTGPGTERGLRFDTRPGAERGLRFDTRPGAERGLRFDTRPGTERGLHFDTRPGTERGRRRIGQRIPAWQASIFRPRISLAEGGFVQRTHPVAASCA